MEEHRPDTGAGRATAASRATGVLEIDDSERLRILRLNRPDRTNALDGTLITALVRALREAALDDDVWAIAITGNGDAFSSGLDLTVGSSDGGEDDDDGGEFDYEHFSILMRVACDKPVVAGVNGLAMGFGLALAMNADIRIAAPSARFHPGYARLGTSPDGGLTWTLGRALGHERAMRFLLEQRWVPASEALALGMISEVTDSDEHFGERFIEYATMLSQVAPIAARQTKRLLVRVDQPTDLSAHLDDEVELALQGLASEDSAEAIRAMVAHERPSFTGR